MYSSESGIYCHDVHMYICTYMFQVSGMHVSGMHVSGMRVSAMQVSSKFYLL